LVLIDIPGMNEADSSKKYKDFVESKWNTFDCVIVVMDVVQGVNTQEQVELLKFVQANNRLKKHIPTIILGNKVDDPEDSEKIALVQETRDKAIEIFGPKCSDAALKELLDVTKSYAYVRENTMGAVFIPISAMNAFIYRKACHLTLETFHDFDKEVVDKIGRDEVGRQWKKLTVEEKVQVIRNAIKDPLQYKERLASTNVDNFLAVLQYFVGGTDAQKDLIAYQIDTSLKMISTKNSKCFSEILEGTFHKCKAVGRETNDLKKVFWDVYNKCEQEALEKAKKEVEASYLERPFNELEKYYMLANAMGWESEAKEVLDSMKQLVQHQLSMVISEHSTWTFDDFCDREFTNQHCGYIDPIKGQWIKPNKLHWKNLSPFDWTTILFSMLLPSGAMEFNLSFGKERRKLEDLLLFLRTRYNPDLPVNGLMPKIERKYILDCRNMDNLNQGVKNEWDRIEMPDELSDPSHWGFLAWKYISFCRSQK
jgi:hypothetical protein